MEKQAFMARFRAGMTAEKTAISARAQDLLEKGCGDDAVLERIRLNICDALLAVANAGEKQGGPEESSVFFEKRFRDISAVWQQGLERALQHGDVKNQAIERIKLDQAERIAAIFQECRGEGK